MEQERLGEWGKGGQNRGRHGGRGKYTEDI